MFHVLQQENYPLMVYEDMLVSAAHEEVADVSQEALSLTSSCGGCVHVVLIYAWVSVKLQNLHFHED